MADLRPASGAAARIEARVDVAAVRHNVRVLRAATAPGAAVMAVVKADGYGHGAVPVAHAALDAGATWLGVCTLDEAMALRGAGITAPLLSWLHLPDEDFAPAVAAGIDLSAASRAPPGRRVRRRTPGRPTGAGAPQGRHRPEPQRRRGGRLARARRRRGEGRSRGGVRGRGGVVAPRPRRHPRASDARRQAARLNAAWRAAVDRGLAPIRHLANAAATLTRPDLHFDLVRPGIAVYGLDPLGRPVGQSPLRPAMTLAARVVLVKRIAGR